jgi:hypothetical protein
VRERGHRLRLPLEPRERVGIGGDAFGEDLDRHLAVQARVARAVDLAHAAGAEGSQNLVRAELRSRDQDHFRPVATKRFESQRRY